MELKDFFNHNKKLALAFSGGVDSAFLLQQGHKYGVDIKPYFVKSEFQPMFELEDAKRLANELNISLSIINLDILDYYNVACNPDNRCYYCKKQIFTSIIEKANKDGYFTIIDGTNASDNLADRPGFRALNELGVISPLRVCGLTKDKIRQISMEEKLFTWNKPSYACLATRVATGEYIEKNKLCSIEQSENYMRNLGLKNFRVRTKDNLARIEISKNDLFLFMQNIDSIYNEIKKYYKKVVLDLEFRKDE